MSDEENKEKKPRIDVTIDQAATIALAKENQKLQDKLDNLDGKEVITSDNESIAEGVKDALRQKYQDKGHVAPSLENKADLENAIAILKDLPTRKAPSGSAPMNPDYYQNTPTYDSHGNLLNKKYSSYAEMFQDLHDIEAVHKGDPKGLQATKMMQDIVRKFFEEHKQNNSPVPNLTKEMPETIEVNGLKVCKNPEDADLQAWNRAYRRRRLLEREERGSVNVKGEEK